MYVVTRLPLPGIVEILHGSCCGTDCSNISSYCLVERTVHIVRCVITLSVLIMYSGFTRTSLPQSSSEPVFQTGRRTHILRVSSDSLSQ